MSEETTPTTARTPLPLIYVAAPFRGPTPLDVRRNVEHARDLGLLVAQAGGYPIIPHTMTADFDKQLTDQFWLGGTMELLKRCDALVLSPEWNRSVGARAELKAAETWGMWVFAVLRPAANYTDDTDDTLRVAEETRMAEWIVRLRYRLASGRPRA